MGDRSLAATTTPAATLSHDSPASPLSLCDAVHVARFRRLLRVVPSCSAPSPLRAVPRFLAFAVGCHCPACSHPAPVTGSARARATTERARCAALSRPRSARNCSSSSVTPVKAVVPCGLVASPVWTTRLALSPLTQHRHRVHLASLSCRAVAMVAIPPYPAQQFAPAGQQPYPPYQTVAMGVAQRPVMMPPPAWMPPPPALSPHDGAALMGSSLGGGGTAPSLSSLRDSVCPHCAANVHGKTKFCGECGKALRRPCPECGAQDQAGKYCEECGSRCRPARPHITTRHTPPHATHTPATPPLPPSPPPVQPSADPVITPRLHGSLDKHSAPVPSPPAAGATQPPPSAAASAPRRDRV